MAGQPGKLISSWAGRWGAHASAPAPPLHSASTAPTSARPRTASPSPAKAPSTCHPTRFAVAHSLVVPPTERCRPAATISHPPPRRSSRSAGATCQRSPLHLVASLVRTKSVHSGGRAGRPSVPPLRRRRAARRAATRTGGSTRLHRTNLTNWLPAPPSIIRGPRSRRRLLHEAGRLTARTPATAPAWRRGRSRSRGQWPGGTVCRRFHSRPAHAIGIAAVISAAA
jgi:hypothetical protein